MEIVAVFSWNGAQLRVGREMSQWSSAKAPLCLFGGTWLSLQALLMAALSCSAPQDGAPAVCQCSGKLTSSRCLAGVFQPHQTLSFFCNTKAKNHVAGLKRGKCML